MKPLIVVDFDDVLVSTTELKEDLFALTVAHGVSREAALIAYTQIRTWPFTPEKFIETLWPNKKEVGVVKKAVGQLFKKSQRYNHSGAEQFLKILGRGCRLLLLTYGVPAFQKLKLRQAKLSAYFDEIIFTNDATKEKALRTLRKKNPGPMVLLDDSLTVCAVAKELDIPAIRIKKTPKDKEYYTAVLHRIAGFLEREKKTSGRS